MRPWDFAVDLDTRATTPLYAQLARGIAEAIRRGRLRPRDPLPGTRDLAARLEIHRNTVLAAYRELHAEGWIETKRARGTFVSESLPDPSVKRATANHPWGARVGFALPPHHEPQLSPSRRRGELSLQGGVPDTRLVPRAALARAIRRALRHGPVSLLDYGDPHGHPRLRAALATMLAQRRGIAARAENLVVTRGSQMALDLIARTLVAPGDRVAVESYGYRPAWEALRRAGAELVPIAVDGEGLDVETLARAATRGPFRAVYVTPHHQYPSTVTLSPGRRLALLAWARAHRCLVIEDDYDHEFHYDGRPILPLASADDAGVVVYIGTLSKLLAPGLRLGFVAAPEQVVDRLASARVFVDRQGDAVIEAAIAEFMEEGELQRHARKMRRAYASRRDAMVEALRRELGSVLAFDVPSGGLALWARVDDRVDPEAWAMRAAASGVLIAAGRRFVFDARGVPYLRVGYAAENERDLREAVRRLSRALPGGPILRTPRRKEAPWTTPQSSPR
jgi:GntR family transcriptional regulator/MocR family aminotransferase